jgi:hypothetical protein
MSRFPPCAWVERSRSVPAKLMPITAQARVEFGGAGSNGCSGARVSHGHGATKGCSSSPLSGVKDLTLKDIEVWGAKENMSVTH